MESLVAMITAIKLQMRGVVVSWSNAGQPQGLTVPREEDVLDTAVLAAHVKFGERVRTALYTLLEKMKTVCSVYHKDFRQLTEWHEIDTGDNLSGIENLVTTEPSYKVLSNAGKGSSAMK